MHPVRYPLLLAVPVLVLVTALARADSRDASDASWAADPVHVYYDGGDCGTDAIEVERWDRQEEVWAPHPRHARVSVPSCQVEDAGFLLNELRWRCAAAPGAEFPPVWRPFRVWDPSLMTRCAVDPIAPGPQRAEIRVAEPAEGVAVAEPEPWLTVSGSVLVDGVAGADYDVVLAIDRAAPPEAVTAQTRALRAWVRGMAPRLGPVRIAVVVYPDERSGPAPAAGARQVLDWSAHTDAIDAALAAVGPVRERKASRGTVPDALDAALAAFAHGRPTARPAIVLGVDGARVDGGTQPTPADPVLRAAARVAERGASLHWVALGGVATDDPSLVRRTLETASGSFRRVPPPSYADDFLADLELPLAESVWIETASDPQVPATLDDDGRFRARVPVQAGANPLVIRARTSDGTEVSRPFDLVFDDSLLRVLAAERERIRAAQRKRLELRPEEETP